jgi:hypothetical protein
MTTPKKPAPPGSIADLTEKIWGRAAHRAPDVQLTAIRGLRILVDQQEQQSAFTMRNMGWSWQAIADATGMKHRQQAQEKFRAATLLDKMDAAHRQGKTSNAGEQAKTNGPDGPRLLAYGPRPATARPQVIEMQAGAEAIVEKYAQQLTELFRR